MENSREKLIKLLKQKLWSVSPLEHDMIKIRRDGVEHILLLLGENGDDNKYVEWRSHDDEICDISGSPFWQSESKRVTSPIYRLQKMEVLSLFSRKFVVLIGCGVNNSRESFDTWDKFRITVITFNHIMEVIEDSDELDFENDKLWYLKTNFQDLDNLHPSPIKEYTPQNNKCNDLRISAVENGLGMLESQVESIQEFVDGFSKQNSKEKTFEVIDCSSGYGFKDIAGMDSLKAQLNTDIVACLKNREIYDQYKLQIPNGLLFYGPPGCGKSFIAQKLAEEISNNSNLIRITPSDINSPWVNESASTLNRLFTFAREIANKSSNSTIIFIDEADGVLMDRSASNTHMQNSLVVNEFLAQTTDTRNKDIIVVVATNRIDALDPAVLRSGRLENKVYIPLPDSSAKEELFKIHLIDRPIDDTIDYRRLSELTEAGYVASDIKLIVDCACRIAISNGCVPVSQAILTQAIGMIQPSVSMIEVKKHETIHQSFTNRSNTTRRRIGY